MSNTEYTESTDLSGLIDLDPEAITLAWQLLYPNITRAQFEHCVTCDPALNGSTFQAYKAERTVVQLLSLLRYIETVASGKHQVVSDDIGGMLWIQNSIRVLLLRLQRSI